VKSNEDRKQRLPRFSLGSQEPVDPTNTQVNDAVNFVADHLSSMSSGMYGVKFHRLVTGTKQVRNSN